MCRGAREKKYKILKLRWYMTTKCCMRKCRNWQTSKTKDLVTAMLCGFKSHLPH